MLKKTKNLLLPVIAILCIVWALIAPSIERVDAASLREKSGTAWLSTTTVTTNLSATGQTTLYTVPVVKSLIIGEGWLKAGGDVGVSLAFTVGQNGAATDFVGTTNGDNLDAANDVILIKPVPSATPATNKVYAAGTVIEIDITAGGNAVAGTVYLFGFLF